MTENGIQMLKLFEALQLETYLDSDGLPTIGWGHLIRDGENFDGPITEEQAEGIFRADLFSHERGMLSLVSVPLRPCELDALVSFVFNTGAKQFKTSTMRKLLNDGAPSAEVADQFPRWVYSDGLRVRGLIRRRNTEAACYLGAGPGLLSAIYGA